MSYFHIYRKSYHDILNFMMKKESKGLLFSFFFGIQANYSLKKIYEKFLELPPLDINHIYKKLLTLSLELEEKNDTGDINLENLNEEIKELMKVIQILNHPTLKKFESIVNQFTGKKGIKINQDFILESIKEKLRSSLLHHQMDTILIEIKNFYDELLTLKEILETEVNTLSGYNVRLKKRLIDVIALIKEVLIYIEKIMPKKFIKSIKKKNKSYNSDFSLFLNTTRFSNALASC